MKKVVLMAIYFLLGVVLISSLNTFEVSEYNRKLQKEITGNKMNNISLKKEITDDEKQLEELKQTNKNKWDELTIWKNIESKIQKALSE